MCTTRRRAGRTARRIRETIYPASGFILIVGVAHVSRGGISGLPRDSRTAAVPRLQGTDSAGREDHRNQPGGRRRAPVARTQRLVPRTLRQAARKHPASLRDVQLPTVLSLPFGADGRGPAPDFDPATKI